MYVVDRAGKNQPMVDRRGRLFRIEDMDPDFVAKYVDAERYREWAGRFVKNAYDPSLGPGRPHARHRHSRHARGRGKAFKIEKHTLLSALLAHGQTRALLPAGFVVHPDDGPAGKAHGAQ